MLIRDLLNFEHESQARLSWSVLQQLNIPMPDDPLEQFIYDHGTKQEFIDAYGEVDIHRTSWSCELLPTNHILGCTTKDENSASYVADVANDFRNGLSGWLDEGHRQEDANHWVENRTWRRPPIFFEHPSIDEGHLHLVEGHTRTGALIGLHRFDPALVLDAHLVWVGRPSNVAVEDPSREVLREHHLSFKNWLSQRRDSDSLARRANRRLMSLENIMRHLPYADTSSCGYEDVVALVELGLGLLPENHFRHTHEGLPELLRILPTLREQWLADIERWLA